MVLLRPSSDVLVFSLTRWAQGLESLFPNGTGENTIEAGNTSVSRR